jgi:hypothetical protein
MRRPLLARLKIMAGLDPRDTGVPEEGRFDFEVDAIPAHVVMNLVPTAGGHGSSAVLHLERSPAEASAAALRAILALQSADGWFGWDRSAGRSDPVDAIARRLGHDPAAWQNAAKAATHALGGAATPDADRVARTAAVLTLLRTSFSGQHRLWRRAEQKAVRYLQGVLQADPAGVRTWLNHLEGQLVHPAATTP